jgi:hypothetical protein
LLPEEKQKENAGTVVLQSSSPAVNRVITASSTRPAFTRVSHHPVRFFIREIEYLADNPDRFVNEGIKIAPCLR